MDDLRAKYDPVQGRIRVTVVNPSGAVLQGLLIQPNGGWRRLLFTMGTGKKNWSATHFLGPRNSPGVWTAKAEDAEETAVVDIVVPGETKEPVRFREFAADPVEVVEGQGTEITGRLEVERGGLWVPFARQPVSVRFRPSAGEWDEVDTVATSRTGLFALRLDPGEAGDVDAWFRPSDDVLVVAGPIRLTYISQAGVQVKYIGKPKTVKQPRNGGGKKYRCFEHTTQVDLSNDDATSGSVVVWLSKKKNGKYRESRGINGIGIAKNPVTGSTSFVYGDFVAGKRYWKARWQL
ncbi:hypothetical protein [Herbidospora sp. RD11066]